ncbi:MAG: hypothetical protein K0S65_1653 [Labilithrix sp.]|nr:hypothetical protein [Labilithrix sp.]
MSAASKKNRRTMVLVVVAAAIAAVVAGVALRSSAPRQSAVAARTMVGVPEAYARPIAVDVNGDGVEDMVLVTSVGGDAFVQAIDGRDGHVLYAIDPEVHDAPLALFARGDRLGVARIPASGNASVSIHELASGRSIQSRVLDPANGRICESAGGSKATPKGAFLFEGAASADASSFGGSGSVSVVDLASAKASQAKSRCGPVAKPNVADVPSASSAPPARFSAETPLRSGAGPYGGRDVVVVPSGLAFLMVDAPVTPGETGAPESHDAGAGTKTVVGLDLLSGTTRFERSLASLGLTTQAVDHIEATEKGALLFFEGDAGVALLDAEHGDRRWTMELPKGHRLASYTLSPTRLYLHVRSADHASAKILVVDLTSGAAVQSIPH